jgi:aconitate hydratase 2/2-methylisocitrate dehydratase
VGSILGRLPTVEEYLEYAKRIDAMAGDIYRYLNFDTIAAFQKGAADGKRIAAVEITEVSMS